MKFPPGGNWPGGATERVLPSLVCDPNEILTVGSFAEAFAKIDQLVPSDKSLQECKLLGTTDALALAPLKRAHKGCGLHQAIVGASVEPGKAPTHLFHAELPALQIGLVDVGDLQLAASRRLEVRRDVHDLLVIKI